MAKDSKKTEVQAPAGFDIVANKVMGDGWVVKAEGVEVLGRLLGRVRNGEDDDGNPKHFYQVKLTKGGVKGTIGAGDETEEVTLAVGQIANVDGSAALSEIAPYCVNGGTYDVWIRYGAKEKGKRGRGFWPAVCRLKMITPPDPKKAKSDSDVPF